MLQHAALPQHVYVLRAPDGCVQYFTGVGNAFQSYNWQGGVQLDAQNYAFCFRREQGHE